jgi:hypothetical protein
MRAAPAPPAPLRLSRTSVWMVAPGDVRPGHMMLAPDSTNLIAPLSARSLGIMSGYLRARRARSALLLTTG